MYIYIIANNMQNFMYIYMCNLMLKSNWRYGLRDNHFLPTFDWTGRFKLEFAQIMGGNPICLRGLAHAMVWSNLLCEGGQFHVTNQPPCHESSMIRHQLWINSTIICINSHDQSVSTVNYHDQPSTTTTNQLSLITMWLFLRIGVPPVIILYILIMYSNKKHPL